MRVCWLFYNAQLPFFSLFFHFVCAFVNIHVLISRSPDAAFVHSFDLSLELFFFNFCFFFIQFVKQLLLGWNDRYLFGGGFCLYISIALLLLLLLLSLFFALTIKTSVFSDHGHCVIQNSQERIEEKKYIYKIARMFVCGSFFFMMAILGIGNGPYRARAIRSFYLICNCLINLMPFVIKNFFIIVSRA